MLGSIPESYLVLTVGRRTANLSRCCSPSSSTNFFLGWESTPENEIVAMKGVAYFQRVCYPRKYVLQRCLPVQQEQLPNTCLFILEY